MKEIKFRCWYDNQMHKVQDISFRDKSINLFGADIINLKDGILMQYTNLKDKNGVEIYEGDIVKINGWWDACGPAGYEANECVVKWDEITTGFEPMCNYDCDCGVYHKASECEVIGNIYEDKLKEEGK